MKLQEKIDIGMPVISVIDNDGDIFEETCKTLVGSGYVVSSTGCGFLDSAEYDYPECLQAVFILKETKS